LPESPLPIILDPAQSNGQGGSVGRTEDGLAVWRLTVHAADVPGRWVIVDREFRQVEESPENPRPWS
jgi:hypothetical protein